MQKQTYIQGFNIIPHSWNTGRIGLDVCIVVGNCIGIGCNINDITGNLGSVVTDISINVWNFITIVYNFNLFKKVKNCLLCLLIVDSLISNQNKLTSRSSILLDTFTMAALLLAMSSETFPTVAYVFWIYREMFLYKLKV